MAKEFKYPEWAQYLTKAVINVTDDCNLACRYCFVEQHPHYMTLDTAKFIADWLYNNLQKKKELGYIPQNKIHGCNIYFFGGEPMLQYKTIIVPLVQYCEEKYPNDFTFGITTNGTLLTKEVIDYFKEKDFSIMFSMDGIRESQEYTRPCKNCNQSSYDLMIKNIPYLIEKIPENHLVYRGTMYRDTVQYIFENYKFAESLGFKSFAYLPDQRHSWNEEQKQILKDQIAKIYNYRLNQIINKITPMKDWRINFWLKQTIDLIKPNSNTYNIELNNHFMRCGLGTTNGSIGYDGSIYGCQEQPSRDDKNIFKIGNIFEGGIDIEKHKRLLKFYFDTQNNAHDHKEECQKCLLQKACKVNTLSCLSSNYDIYQNFDEITDIECLIRQEYVSNSLLYLILFSQVNDKKENEWVSSLLKDEIMGKK